MFEGMKSLDGSGFVSAQQAALEAKVSDQTVRQLVQRGKLRGHQDDDGRWWVLKSSLEAYVLRNAPAPSGSEWTGLELEPGGDADTHAKLLARYVAALGVQARILVQIEADAREAEQRGDPQHHAIASAMRVTAATLKSMRYVFDEASRAWAFEVNGERVYAEADGGKAAVS